MDISSLTKVVRSASRKAFFRHRALFSPYAAVSPDELRAVERRIGMPMPDDLREWLLALGYGDLNEEISFRKEWFAAIESGQLKGSARFAQDLLGNFYAFDASGRIYFLSRSEPAFSIISESFSGFVEELVRRDYKLVDWVASLATRPYEWQSQ
ncbi:MULTISPECIES: SMI1/KNR4 family protein [unclassified Rhizobacter]|uniref:SMI1/KNR4 family protein n=1 Tax=unclassified Rhizobacter TaxID=2640088 RepID=UPI0012F7788C|nr:MULTISPECIES: SMI1/KNR4 family protein [unclassified Rhizobacter]